MPSLKPLTRILPPRPRPISRILLPLILLAAALGLPAPAARAAGGTTLFLPVLMNAGQNSASAACIPAKTVTDPYYLTYQANMRQIHADQAWASCLQGSPQVVVAVVDGGVDLTHPDLAGNLLPGYNFVENNTVPADDNGHGTHVAGIVAAELNGIGVVGVTPQVKILPVRVMSNGSGSNSTIAAGIRWAADRAQIINLSLGGTSSSRVLQDAINYAISKGRIVVAAAGNDGANGNPTEYPAAFPGVIAVGAVDSSGQHASFSSTGSYVTLSAPGVDIVSTFLNGGYAASTGTSMAAPHVSGLAGLIWAAHPGYTASQVVRTMESTAADLGAAGWDPVYGYGLIDADPAASLALSASAAAAPSAAPLQPLTAPPAAPLREDRTAPLVPGRVLVKLRSGAGRDRLGSASADVSGEIPGGVLILTVPDGQEWARVNALRAIPAVEAAEPDYLLRTTG